MSHQNQDSASPVHEQDQELVHAPEAHRPEPETGAPVHTGMHRSKDSAIAAETAESPSETYSVWPQIGGVDPFTRTAPLHAHGQIGRDARRCTGAHQSAPYEKPKELPEKQQRAIELLIAGKTYTHIAERLGIDRSTLWRWRNRDHDFRRALAAAREDAYRDADGRLRELVPRALEVLESHLDKDDYQAAVRVLRMVRVDGQQALRSFGSRPFLGGGL